jgi:hypothetical protein
MDTLKGSVLVQLVVGTPAVGLLEKQHLAAVYNKQRYLSIIMADDNNGDDIFVYTGGEQEVPRDVKRVRIAENIDTVPHDAFSNCKQLIEVKGHDKLKKIEGDAFYFCESLSRLSNMNGVIEIEDHAFSHCHALSDLEFVKLEIIGDHAISYCRSLSSINLPSVRRIGQYAFRACTGLTEAVFGEDLERIERSAFWNCFFLGLIAIPLKHSLIVEDDAFDECRKLLKVDVVVGGIQKTISSFPKESWKNE